jgi:hypothetical protein
MRLRVTDYPARPRRSIIPGSDNLSLWTSLYPRQHDDGAGGWGDGFMTSLERRTFDGLPRFSAALRKIL